MKILNFPHPSLTKPTVPWDFSQEDSRAKLLFVAIDMGKVLEQTPHGVALAANQVGLPHRLFVVRDDFADQNDLPTIVINPQVIGLLSGEEVAQEGCLSFPGTLVNVNRLSAIVVGYQNIDGEPQTKQLEGFPARMVQHECEHLDGKTFIDRVPRIDRFRIMAELKRRKVGGRA